MFKSILTLSVRNLLRTPISSLISILGFALGITCCFVIYFKISYESGFDKFHTDYDKIYRVVRQTKGLGLNLKEGEFEYREGVFGALPNAIKKEIPEVIKITSVLFLDNLKIKIPHNNTEMENTIFKLKGGVGCVKPDFFALFDFKNTKFKWLMGNPQQSFKEPFSIVLTRHIAQKYFGNSNPLGKTIIFFDKLVFAVTGVVDDFPSNTDFPFEMMVSFNVVDNFWPGFTTDWGGLTDSYQCFILLRDIHQRKIVEEKLKKLYARHASTEESENRLFKLQPLAELHADGRFGNFNSRVVSKDVILSLALIGLFFIIVSCVNYANLSLARSSVRTKEVGIRKTFGSKQWRIILQFLSESFILTLLSLLIGVLLSKIILNGSFSFIGIPMEFGNYMNISVLCFMLCMVVIVSLLSAFYPAFALSAYNPVELLKNRFVISRNGKLNFIRSMIITQFAISLVLIICTIVVYRQLHYVNTIDPGFNKNEVFTLEVPNSDPGILEHFKAELLKNPAIENVSFASTTPAESRQWTDVSRIFKDHEKRITIQLVSIDSSYLKTYGLRLVAGRNISSMDSSNGILVNEELIRDMEFENPEDAIGAVVNLFGNPQYAKRITGVIHDYYSESLHYKVRPVVLIHGKNGQSVCGIRFHLNNIYNMKTNDQMSRILNDTQKYWKKFFPENEFEYHFLEDKIEAYYRNDQNTFRLFMIFSIVLIFITCIGVFGLAQYTGQQRSKEIAVRKVNGITNSSIFLMLGKDYFTWIVIALIIANPIALFVMRKWLENYACKIALSWWIFALAGGMVLMIALLTISWQSLRSATRNPVEDLKYE